MTKRILVDAAHPEEVRVAVAEDTKLIEFEFETAEKKQIKNNIYLGKITRVEPSLQAAFVEYGGNRQGFLPFSEIHYDYYQIPTEDKQKLKQMLLDEKAKIESLEDEKEEIEAEKEEPKQEESEGKDNKGRYNGRYKKNYRNREEIEIPEGFDESDKPDLIKAHKLAKIFAYEIMGEEYVDEKFHNKTKENKEEEQQIEQSSEEANTDKQESAQENKIENDADDEQLENDNNENYNRSDFYKKYKIQEVIKRNQVVLVQVLKEERGNKGATLSTYVSLAGRYSVLMPNTEKGGGVSRRISSFTERKRIRSVIRSLEVPQGSSIIVRTAGAGKEEDEIKRDYDYIASMWNNIREETMKSTAPCLIYEESDIVRRSIRDLFKGDVEEIVIEGKDHYKNAAKFLESVAPNQKDSIKQHRSKIPIFQKYKIEDRLDELYEHEVKLESGGSIVISPTEALVAIDVNSGKSTKERSVEDTAIKTNIEAANEIARQLKLRDLAGLIVIDFIDMRDIRNRKAVERELKDALKSDRAKIQVGRISAFGLLEMSRQRLHSSLIESSSHTCPMCNGIGVVRSMDSTTLKVIRAIQGESGKKSVGNIVLTSSSDIYREIKKRISEIKEIEKNDNVNIKLDENVKMLPNQFEISTSDSPAKSNSNKDKRPNLSQNEEQENEENIGNSENYESDNGRKTNNKGKKNYKGRGNKKYGNKRGNYKDRKNNYQNSSDNQPQEQNDNSNVTSIDAANNSSNKSGGEDKSSKLMGLWKKITS